MEGSDEVKAFPKVEWFAIHLDFIARLRGEVYETYENTIRKASLLEWFQLQIRRIKANKGRGKQTQSFLVLEETVVFLCMFVTRENLDHVIILTSRNSGSNSNLKGNFLHFNKMMFELHRKEI